MLSGSQLLTVFLSLLASFLPVANGLLQAGVEDKIQGGVTHIILLAPKTGLQLSRLG